MYNQTGTKNQDAAAVMNWGRFRMDLARHEVEVKGVGVELTLTEFRLLALLLAGRGRVVTREDILREVWGSEDAGRPRALDVHIRRLRSKLGDVASASIVTIRKVGYRLVPD